MTEESNFNYNAVIILSHSDWFKEMRSNRYNYAMRFARLAPVYFVQNYDPDSKSDFFTSVDHNIEIVNPIDGYSSSTMEKLLREVKRRGANNILFWVYSPHYSDVLSLMTIQFTAIYHATEAYLGSDMLTDSIESQTFLKKLKKTINFCSLVIAVSQGVTKGIEDDPEIIVPVYTVTNGCDYSYWEGFEKVTDRKNQVLYQGGIHKKLDFQLIKYVVKDNPEVEFLFCGEEVIGDNEDRIFWTELLSLPNFKYLGKLNPDEVRSLSHDSKVGIIPFKNESWLKNKSFPLKAFEYMSAGLEVVTVDIDAIQEYDQHFRFANEPKIFSQKIKESILEFPPYSDSRKELCKSHDYDRKFEQVLNIIKPLKLVQPITRNFKKSVLLIYDRNSCHVGNLREHLDAFGLFSKHSITFINGTGNQEIASEFMDSFDAVVVHYSVRISVPGHLSASFYNALKKYSGLKILFIQDEYDNVKSTFEYLKNIDFSVLYTIINEDYCYKLYPASVFPHLKIIYILTGYVPYKLTGFSTSPLSKRETDVFYRGRELPYYYGTLGVEKYQIGVKFFEACQKNGLDLRMDVDSANSSRIYGDGWYKALSTSKTMLGTESGSNVFDMDGDLHELINQDIASGLTYDEIYDKRLRASEKEWKVNMISPKAFEAIMLGTVLVLYEGEYSGVLTPHRHYIPLKKDFSNIVEVVNIIRDDKKLEEIAQIAYEEIACNPIYSYEYFTKNNFDKIVDENVLIFREKNLVPDGKYYISGRKRVNGVFLNTLTNKPVGYIPPTSLSSESEYIHDSQFNIKSSKWSAKKYLKQVGRKTFEFMPGRVSRIISAVYSRVRNNAS